MASGRDNEDKSVCLGVIVGASGIKGEVRIKPYTAAPEDVGAYGPVTFGDQSAGSFGITVTRSHKEGVIVRLEGVEDRDAAEALKGTELYVGRATLPAEEEDEYYHADLIGLAVEDQTGATLGRVKAVYDFGAGEMLEIEVETGGVAMMPFTMEAVPQVLLKENRIVVDPPEGVMPRVKEPKDPDRPTKAGKKAKKGEKHV